MVLFSGPGLQRDILLNPVNPVLSKFILCAIGPQCQGLCPDWCETRFSVAAYWCLRQQPSVSKESACYKKGQQVLFGLNWPWNWFLYFMTYWEEINTFFFLQSETIYMVIEGIVSQINCWKWSCSKGKKEIQSLLTLISLPWGEAEILTSGNRELNFISHFKSRGLKSLIWHLHGIL